MRPYTWKEIANASKKTRKLIIETYGLLGAVAIEVAGALTGKNTPLRGLCAVNQHLKSSSLTFDHICPQGCPLSGDACNYENEGKFNLLKTYAKLYKKAKRKKHAR